MDKFWPLLGIWKELFHSFSPSICSLYGTLCGLPSVSVINMWQRQVFQRSPPSHLFCICGYAYVNIIINSSRSNHNDSRNRNTINSASADAGVCAAAGGRAACRDGSASGEDQEEDAAIWSHRWAQPQLCHDGAVLP